MRRRRQPSSGREADPRGKIYAIGTLGVALARNAEAVEVGARRVGAVEGVVEKATIEDWARRRTGKWEVEMGAEVGGQQSDWKSSGVALLEVRRGTEVDHLLGCAFIAASASVISF